MTSTWYLNLYYYVRSSQCDIYIHYHICLYKLRMYSIYQQQIVLNAGGKPLAHGGVISCEGEEWQ